MARRRLAELLSEAAMGVQDLPPKLGVEITKLGPDSMRIGYWHMTANRRALKSMKDPVDGHLLIGKKGLTKDASAVGGCENAFMIQWSRAQKGWGPLLYDVAVEATSLLGGGLMADRFSVSDEAHAVWQYYLTRRSDVDAHQLDDFEAPHLTKSKKDDCAQVSSKERAAKDAAGLVWHETPESKRITKSPTTLKALAADGRLHIDGLSLPFGEKSSRKKMKELKA